MKNEKAPIKSKSTKKKKLTPTRGVRLKGPKDVTRLLNRLINQVLQADEEGAIGAQNKLRTIAYAMSNLLKALEVGELSERISKIEDFIKCQDLKQKSTKPK